MNATYDYKGVKNAVSSQMKKISLPILILLLAIILCVNNIAVHFINKWDGHFHDTKGCTNLQSLNGKIYKVDSCENIVEPISAPEEKEPIKGFNNFNPDDMLAPPSQPPAKTPAPPKKPQAPKDNMPPKQNPYMI